MNKKGFTLVELLAVIVIIGIISLITTPIIIDIVDQAKKSAFSNSAYGLIKAADNSFNNTRLIENPTETTYTFANGVETRASGNVNLAYNGEKPQNGTIIINSTGDIALAIHNGKYCVSKWYTDKEVTIVESILSECEIIAPILVDDSGANAPVLATGMTPVIWDGSNWISASNTNSPYKQNWYDYGEKKWANAMTADGSMWVWIPRYAYQIASGYHTNTAGTINVKFLQGTTNVANDSTSIYLTPTYSGSSQTNYIKHPAFTFGSTELTGIWVAKFEASEVSSTLEYKPGVLSKRSILIGYYFMATRNMETKSKYGWALASGLNTDGTFTNDTNNVDTHMMKNIEWGSVAYLSNSIYGKNSEITISNLSDYYTGGGSGNAYVTNVNQSTTGTINGIYDINGGAHEYVMGNYNNTKASSDVDPVVINDKYIERYYTTYSSAKYGDAVYETSSSNSGSTSWYGDYSTIINGSYPWFMRGGYYNSSTSSGAFAFYLTSGAAGTFGGFRATLLVGEGL